MGRLRPERCLCWFSRSRSLRAWAAIVRPLAVTVLEKASSVNRKSASLYRWKRRHRGRQKKSHCKREPCLQFFGGAADELAVRGSSHASGSPELEARDQTHGA